MSSLAMFRAPVPRPDETVVMEFRQYPKDDLYIDTRKYQRDTAEGRIAARIASDFNKVAFGALLVIKRADESKVVADGGTRLSAARLLPDVKTVPCVVFSGLSEEQEGQVFILVNNNRAKLDTAQQHKAEVFTGYGQATEAQRLMDLLHEHRVQFDGLQTMRIFVKKQHGALKDVAHILTRIAADRHVSARVLKALVTLEAALQSDGRTLMKPALIKRMHDRLHQFGPVVDATVATASNRADATLLARGLAKTIGVRFPTKPKKKGG